MYKKINNLKLKLVPLASLPHFAPWCSYGWWLALGSVGRLWLTLAAGMKKCEMTEGISAASLSLPLSLRPTRGKQHNFVVG